MNENNAERIPRMRTAPNIVAGIKAMDPHSEVTENYIRQLAKDGAVPVVWAGRKALINLDDVLDILRTGTDRPQASPTTVDGIRRVDLRVYAGKM